MSPRGTLALTQASQGSAMLHGRDYVTPDDVKSLFVSVCGHRVLGRAYMSNGESGGNEAILKKILDEVPAPR